MGVAPSVPADRSRTLQVIGAGFSRTGTVSMTLALEKLLAGPVMHGGSQIFGREDAYMKLWVDIYRAREARDKTLMLKLLRDATAGFVAITDVPGIYVLEELQELYPDAEVITVHRDKKRWFKSVKNLNDRLTPWWLYYLLLPCPGWRWLIPLIDCLYRVGIERRGGEDTKLTIDTLDEHNTWVREHTPPEKFHVMELSEGWAPLCRILNKPLPQEPFPRANDAEAMARFGQIIVLRAVMVWVGILAGIGMAAYGGVLARRAWFDLLQDY